MKVIGITRVRNEELILADTLAHFLQYVDHIILLDDDSTDGTVGVARGFDRVTVIAGGKWSTNRPAEETRHRKLLTEAAMDIGADWVLCFDADERLLLWSDKLVQQPHGADAFRFRLFDGYMVEGSPDYKAGKLLALPRMWGPEYRDIIMLFRPEKAVWSGYDRREPMVMGKVEPFTGVVVAHYGKCLSVDHWEQTCDYYAGHWPEPYRSKWAGRRGKAIHTESDFGRPLYPLLQAILNGVKL